MLKQPVPYADITFVVQGPVHHQPRDAWGSTTKQCLDSIRRYFPGSTIILSSYLDSDINGLDFDRVVLSVDPGGVKWVDRDNPSNILSSNVNRMIVTSLQGLRQVTTKYACKVRSDIVFSGSSLARQYKDLDRDPALTFTMERIHVLDYFTRNADTHGFFSYCVSDLLFFGRTQDVTAFFDIPLATEATISNFFNESFLTVSFLEKFRDITYTHYRDCGKLQKDSYVQLLANQFVVENAEDIDVHLPFRKTIWDRSSIYSHSDWQKLYRIHCRGQAFWKIWLLAKSAYLRLLMCPFELRKKLRIRTRARLVLSQLLSRKI